MIKPNIPNMSGMSAMTDSLEFVKGIWGSMGIPGATMPSMSHIPGMAMPTLSVEEITKKIADLRAVESWLELNMGMLRTGIHALEVQAATLSALQSMGDALKAGAAASTSPPAEAKSQDEAPHAKQGDRNDEPDANLSSPLVNATAWWNILQDQFKQAVTNAAAMAPDVGASKNPVSESFKKETEPPASSSPRKRKTPPK